MKAAKTDPPGGPDGAQNQNLENNPMQSRMEPGRSRRPLQEAAAPTDFCRAGGVHRNAAPNRFQTLIEAIAEVR